MFLYYNSNYIFWYIVYSKRKEYVSFLFIELSAMVTGMDDAHKYVVVNYQLSDELDIVFEKFMKQWL